MGVYCIDVSCTDVRYMDVHGVQALADIRIRSRPFPVRASSVLLFSVRLYSVQPTRVNEKSQ